MTVFRSGGFVSTLLLVLLTAATMLPSPLPALVAASPELFSPAGPSSAGERYAGRGVLRSRLVEVDIDRLAAAAASPQGSASTLILNLFDDVVLTALPERVTALPPHGFALSGQIAGVELSQVTLVVRDGVLAGNVSLPGAFYQVRPAGDGVHVVQQIDQAAFPDEMEPIPVEAPDEAPAAPLSELADDGSIIDVMVVYTSEAANWAGDILAVIDLAVQETNDSYANSGIIQRVRLVHAAQVSYTQSGSISTDLSRLRNTSDGYMDQVHTLRNTYGADEVVLLVSYPSSNVCGIAYLMDPVGTYFESWAFAVVDVDCATGYYSFGHEMGHNMGARHDWYVDDTATPYGHAHGYLNYTSSSNPYPWRTVMAYNDECHDQGYYCYRLPYWSNPTVSWYGAAMGVSEGTSTACAEGIPHPICDADNRKTLNKTAYTVANFRASVPRPPSAPSGLTATAVSQTRVDLAWNDNSSDETGFKIERSLAGAGTWSQIASVGANVEAYANTTGLVSGTSYDYRVRAYNAQGNSAYSNVATATTLAESGPLAFVGYLVDDDNLGGSSGNGDGRIDCGETIELYVDLQNMGGVLADNVQVDMASPSPYVTWLDSGSYYGDIAGGTVARNTDAFDVQISPSTPHGHVLQFDLLATALNGGPWPDSFSAVVRCGGPLFVTYLPLLARSITAGFDSQFNGSAAGWEAHTGSWGIESAAFYVSDGVAGAWASASYASSYGELDYRARIWRQGCTTCSHGLLVRGSPEPPGSEAAWDKGYGFYIARDGYYTIYTYSGGSGVPLQPWTFSTAISQGDAWNELRVVASGSQLAFYINGGLVWIGNNAVHPSGRVGLAMYRDPGSSGNKLWVDWATLVPQASAIDVGELSREQRLLNEAALHGGASGSDGQAPDR
jgi:hypothetical protein